MEFDINLRHAVMDTIHGLIDDLPGYIAARPPVFHRVTFTADRAWASGFDVRFDYEIRFTSFQEHVLAAANRGVLVTSASWNIIGSGRPGEWRVETATVHAMLRVQ